MQELNPSMFGVDLVKVIMFVGIIFAMLGSRWLSKLNVELDEKLRLARERADHADIGRLPKSDQVQIDT